MQKKCTKCGEVKSVEGFSKDKSKRDGLQSNCKECNAVYKQANRERIREYQQKYHQENRERFQEQKREYYQENRERLVEKQRKYNQANRERIRKYHQANRGRILERQRKYRETYPERVAFSVFCTRIGKSTKEVLEDYNMTLEQIWAETREFYLESRRLTEETGEPHHVDHIQPLCEGGEHRAHNLQVLTGSENQSKGGHWTQADDDLTDEDIERLDQEALSFSLTLTLA